MRSPLDVDADVTLEHGGHTYRLLGNGSRLELLAPGVRATLALRRAGVAGFFSLPIVRALHAASGVDVDVKIGPTTIASLPARPASGERLPSLRLNLPGLLMALLQRVVFRR